MGQALLEPSPLTATKTTIIINNINIIIVNFG